MRNEIVETPVEKDESTGNDRKDLLGTLSQDLKEARKFYKPVLDRDQKINKPFTELEKAVDERLKEQR